MSIGHFMDCMLLMDIFYIASSFVLSIITQFSFIVKLVVVEEVEVAKVDESHPTVLKRKSPKF